MGTSRLNVPERLLLIAATAAIFVVLGLLVAGALTASPSVGSMLPRAALVPRGEIALLPALPSRLRCHVGMGCCRYRRASEPDSNRPIV